MKKLIPLIIALTAFSVSAVFAQSATSSPSPGASPSASKHKHIKKVPSAAVSGVSPAAASPSPGKHSWLKTKKAAATVAASPAAGATATPTPSTKGAKAEPTGTPAPGGGAGMVWVNTTSHVYHKEGSKWYGRTKHGKYISEQDAIKEGDHLDKEDMKSK
jgi:hypothetical protein